MKNVLMNKTIVPLYDRAAFDDLEDATASSTIQDEGLYGMAAQVIEEVSADWVKIRMYYGYEGYVPVKDLYFIAPEEMQKRTTNQLRFVMKGYADVLSLPKVQGIKLLGLTRGAVVRLAESAQEPGGWAKVILNDGTVGYMKEGFLGEYHDTPVYTEERLRESLASTAKLYLGTQYRWAGKSTLGIDCSGLCSMAYLLNGIKIYRDAQLKEGYPVHEIKYQDKKTGDLLYFPGHIAMYLKDDRYIHSTGKNGSDGVVINSLNPEDPLYREDLVKSMYAVGSIFG